MTFTHWDVFPYDVSVGLERGRGGCPAGGEVSSQDLERGKQNVQKRWELCRGGDAHGGVQSWTDPAEERGPQSGPAGRAAGENQVGVRSCPGQMPEESHAGSAWQHGKPLPA